MARVVRDYTPQYPDPITARAGDRVLVGPDDPEFPGWRWCTGPDGRMGWVAEELLQREGQDGVLLRDYTARELSVRTGAEVIIGEAISSWVWVTDADGRAGWIPEICLAPQDTRPPPARGRWMTYRSASWSARDGSNARDAPVCTRGGTEEVVMAGQGSTGNVIAALASFFIPGLGQLLQGRLGIAIVQFCMAAVLWFILMGWIIHLWSILDAAMWKPKA